MKRDYSDLVNLSVELGQYQGYLDTLGEKKEREVRGKYEAALRAFVYSLLKGENTAQSATHAVNADVDEITAASDPSWQSVYDEVRGDILTRIDREAGKKPWQRTLRRRLPLIIGAILIASYFGVRLYSATPVDQPLETAAGLDQRAAAMDKAIRYDGWASTHVRRGGWMKGLLLWPIEPSASEMKGAMDLAGLSFGAAKELQDAGQAFAVPVPALGETLNDPAMELLSGVTADLRGPQSKRSNPPVLAIINSIRRRYPC